VSTLGLCQDGPRASTEVAAPAIPGARAVQALGRLCPREAPTRIDCNGDGVLDILVPSYHEGTFNHYMTPEMGAQFGIIGAANSTKAFSGNQNFTQAGALAGPDGRLLWTFKAGAMIHMSRVLAEEGRLYVASHDDILRALALESGKVVWQQDLKGNILGLVGSRDQIVAVSAKNDITAFKRDDGTVLWRKSLKTAVMLSPNFGVLLADDSTLFVAALDNHVSALERASGERRWDFKTAANASLRLLTGNTLLIAVQKELIALDAASGSLRWRVDVGGPVHAEPIADLGGQIVFLQPFGDSKLMALDPSTGKVTWSVNFEKTPRDKDRKIVTPEDAALYKSSLEVQRDAEGRPRLLLAADRASVRAVRLVDGKVL
jgi:glucose dehydrogenase